MGKEPETCSTPSALPDGSANSSVSPSESGVPIAVSSIDGVVEGQSPTSALASDSFVSLVSPSLNTASKSDLPSTDVSSMSGTEVSESEGSDEEDFSVDESKPGTSPSVDEGHSTDVQVPCSSTAEEKDFEKALNKLKVHEKTRALVKKATESGKTLTTEMLRSLIKFCNIKVVFLDVSKCVREGIEFKLEDVKPYITRYLYKNGALLCYVMERNKCNVKQGNGIVDSIEKYIKFLPLIEKMLTGGIVDKDLSEIKGMLPKIVGAIASPKTLYRIIVAFGLEISEDFWDDHEFTGLGPKMQAAIAEAKAKKSMNSAKDKKEKKLKENQYKQAKKEFEKLF